MSKNVLLNLISGAKSDYRQIARILRRQPYFANNFDKAGNSLLHRAVEKQDYALVKLLLDSGADPNIRNNIGYTPLHFAVIFKHIPILELLINNNANINSRSNSGKTPMHLLSMQEETDESIKIVEILLKNYASTSVRDRGGHTPLDYLNSTK